MASTAESIGTCFVCGRSTGHPKRAFGGLKGGSFTLLERVCSPECGEELRRFAPRKHAQATTSSAGLLVALLGVVTGLLFVVSSRDLGRPLIVLAVLGAGTTRLAYPDAVPGWLARRMGLVRARESLQWLGVGLGLAAVALAVWFVFG